MIVNCRIEITNDWRQLLASHIAGKLVRRMVTRKEVCEFVSGCIEAACEDCSYDQPEVDAEPIKSRRLLTSNLSADELAVVGRLRDEGKSESYIVGWLVVGRGAGAPRPRF